MLVILEGLQARLAVGLMATDATDNRLYYTILGFRVLGDFVGHTILPLAASSIKGNPPEAVSTGEENLASLEVEALGAYRTGNVHWVANRVAVGRFIIDIQSEPYGPVWSGQAHHSTRFMGDVTAKEVGGGGGRQSFDRDFLDSQSIKKIPLFF